MTLLVYWQSRCVNGMNTTTENPLFNGWPDGLIEVDENGTILCTNPATESILGWSSSDLTGKKAHQALCAEGIDSLHTPEECPFVSPRFFAHPDREELRWKERSGDTIAVHAKGLMVPGTTRTIRLIQFSDASDQPYKLSDVKQLANFAERSPTPIMQVDPEANISFTNPAMITLMTEMGFDDAGQARCLPGSFYELVKEVAESHSPKMAIKNRIDDRHFRWDFFPYPDEVPATGVQVYGRDITASENLAQSLMREKEAAEAANQAKSNFLSLMSHELRTPMNSIIGFTRRVITKGEKDIPPQYINALKTVLTNAHRLLTMINETLDMSKIEAGKMQPMFAPVNIVDLTQEISTLLKVQAEDKGLTFSVYVDESVPASFQSDQDYLRKIIINLTGNAIKFTDEGGIDIGLRCPDDQSILIAVRDDGIGISEEDQQQIFDRFTQSSTAEGRRYNGTGLGLALCRELTKLLGGEIGVSSALGEGSTFWVQLPIPTDEPTWPY